MSRLVTLAITGSVLLGILLSGCDRLTVEWVRVVAPGEIGQSNLVSIGSARGLLYGIGTVQGRGTPPCAMVVAYDHKGDLRCFELFRQADIAASEGLAIIPQFDGKKAYALIRTTDVHDTSSLLIIECDSAGRMLRQEKVARVPGEQVIAGTMAIDHAGDIIVGWLARFPSLQTSLGLAKYRPADGLVWATRCRTPRSCSDGLRLAIGSDTYAIGVRLEEENGFFCVRINTSGVALGSAVFDMPEIAEDDLAGMALGRQGQLYMAGSGKSSRVKDQVIAARFDAEAKLQWAVAVTEGNSVRALGTGIDDSGNLYLCCNATADDGRSAVVTIKYDTEGNEVWRRRYGPGNVHDFEIESGVEAPLLKVRGLADNRLLIIDYDLEGNVTWRQHLRLSLARGSRIARLVSSGNYFACNLRDAGGKESGVVLVKLGVSRWAGQRWD